MATTRSDLAAAARRRRDQCSPCTQHSHRVSAIRRRSSRLRSSSASQSGRRPLRHPGQVGPERARDRGQAVDLLQQQDLGPVQVGHQRRVREQRRGRVVDGCQVVEVQDRGRLRPRAAEDARPGPHDVVSDLGREGGEHPVGRPRPVLEGGMHRHGLGVRVATLRVGPHGVVVGDRGQAARA